MNETKEYLTANLRRALAVDARVSTQDINVIVSGDCVYLQGQVTTERRRQAAADVVNELAPQLEVINQLEIVELKEPDKPENVS
jgi:osmotically-inducible protein OsmY